MFKCFEFLCFDLKKPPLYVLKVFSMTLLAIGAIYLFTTPISTAQLYPCENITIKKLGQII